MVDFSKLKPHYITMLVFILLAAAVVWPFLTVLAFSAIMAYFFYPAFAKMSKKISRFWAAGIITFFLILVTIFFIQYGINFIFKESANIYAALSNVDLSVFGEQTRDMLRNVLLKIISYFSDQAFKLPQLLLSAVIFFISFFYFLADGERIIAWARKVLPLSEMNKTKVFESIHSNIRAFVHVQGLVAVAQFIVAYLGFRIFGLPYPFLAGLAAGILSFIPVVGPYIIYLPVGFGLIFLNHTSAGIGLLIYGLLIGSFLDYIVRPYLIGRQARLHPLIIFIGVFGGLLTFGLAGVVIGPVLLSIAILFIRELTGKGDGLEKYIKK